MKTPTFSLDSIKSVFSTVDNLRMTISVRQSLVEMGATLEDVVMIVQSLNPGNFHKSMLTNSQTRYCNQEIWQDVYHVVYKGRYWYVKFMANENGFYLVSCKENFKQLLP